MTRRLTLALLALSALSVAGLWWAWRRGHGPGDALPADAREYVGSAACQPCHAKQFDDWSASSHAHNMAVASPESMRADFTTASVIEHGGTRARPVRDASGQRLEISEADGQAPTSYSTDYVLGTRRHQVYLHKLPNGQLQVLPTYWNVEQRAWKDAHDGALAAAPTPLGRTHPEHWRNYGRTFNRSCMECHSSQPVEGYDAARNTYASVFDPQINCEACHGPGGRHTRAWQGAGQVAGAPGTVLPGADMPRLGLLDEGASIELCTACHARKRVYREGWRPDQPMADFHAPDVWETTGFFVDGRPSDLRYSFVEYMQSACSTGPYRSSPAKLGCAECHPPYSLARPAAAVGEANTQCTRCHVQYRDALTAHTFHRPESEGSRCVECHSTCRA